MLTSFSEYNESGMNHAKRKYPLDWRIADTLPSSTLLEWESQEMEVSVAPQFSIYP